MKTIKNLEGTRWFIWAICFIVVSLVGLTIYVWYVSQIDSAEPTEIIRHNGQQSGKIPATSTPILEADLLNTKWAPQDGLDAVLFFNTTKNNDKSHNHYDYQFASDSIVRETGYWAIVNEVMHVTPMKVYAIASGIEKITKKDQMLLIYFKGAQEPVVFVQWQE